MAFLITIEGGEGSGKSTLLNSIQKLLQKNNIPMLSSREPGGTAVGEEVREILLKSGREKPMAPLAELFLYEAARHQHVSEVILPALKRNTHVFCDRYAESSIAYQGFGRGLDLDLVRQLNHTATLGLKPDATIWLKIAPEIGVKRSIQSGGKNRYEEEKIVFHQKVFNGFLTLSKENKNFIVLDATQTVEEVFQQLITHPKWIELFGELK